MIRFVGKTAARVVLLGVAMAGGIAAAGIVTQPQPPSHPEEQAKSTTVTNRSN